MPEPLVNVIIGGVRQLEIMSGNIPIKEKCWGQHIFRRTDGSQRRHGWQDRILWGREIVWKPDLIPFHPEHGDANEKMLIIDMYISSDFERLSGPVAVNAF